MADLTKKHKTKLPWLRGNFRYYGTTFIGYCVKRSIASTVCKNLSKLAYQKGLKEKEQYANEQILRELEKIKFIVLKDYKELEDDPDKDCYKYFLYNLDKRIKELKEVKP